MTQEKIIWWRVVLVLAIAFAVASVALAKLLSLVPDSSKLSP
jgi:hypothetical protein